MQNHNTTIEERLALLSTPEIEKQVLGEILTYCEDEEAVRAVDVLEVGAFSISDYQKIFTAVKNIRRENKSIDIVNLLTELSKTYQLTEAQRLHNIAVNFNAVSSIHLREHSDILAENHKKIKSILLHQKDIERLSDLTVSYDDAIREEEEERKALSNDRGTRFRDILTTEQSEDDFFAPFADRTPEVKTHYSFARKGTDGNRETLTLPTGALTFVCAPTSHGKSTFCQNLALDVARTNDGYVLYFTYEESRDDVKLQFLNKYIGRDISRSNVASIRHYAMTKNDEMIVRDMRPMFHQQKGKFISELIKTGKLNIIYKNYDCFELVEAMREIGRQLKQVGERISAVFIDYVQLLCIKDCKKQRREELRDIAQMLRTTAIELQVPIVLAAQLNREAMSPMLLFNEYIAEAADLEREANKIICLWNTSFKARCTSSKDAKDVEKWEEEHKVTLGNSEQIYIFAILTKNRGSIRGLEATWGYHGNSGKITDENFILQEQSVFGRGNTEEEEEPF